MSRTRQILLNSRERNDSGIPAVRRNLNAAVKRGIDIFIAIAGLTLLAPAFALIAWWVRRDSPGPIFFKGRRSGKGGKAFHILKFRTMYETVESYQGSRVTGLDDPRITPFGRELRDTKLNELPQLWNVLKGEMSLVGPRPEDPEITRTWPEDVAAEIFSVRPGITSPASVLYRDEETQLHGPQVMDTYLQAILPSKLRLDQLYVRHHSLLLDFDTLLWTFIVLLPRVGAIAPPEEQLFLGPLAKLIYRHFRWLLIDWLVTLAAIGATGIFWRSFGPLNVGVSRAVSIALGFAVLYSLVGALTGVNRIAWSQAHMMDIMDLVLPVGLATAIAVLANYFWVGEPSLPMPLVLMAAVLSFIGYVAVRYRIRLIRELAERWLRARGTAMKTLERVLIIGSGDSGQFMAWWLNSGRNQGLFHIVGYVDDDLYKQDTRIRGVNVLGRREDIPNLVVKYDVGIILFAIHNIPDSERDGLLQICQSTAARVYALPDILASLKRVANGLEENETAGEVESIENIPADDLASWLDELETRAESGDLAGIQQQIHRMREKMIRIEGEPEIRG